ncbi:hypothetical protein SK224_16075 [Microbacterium sp. BG28]|uniref:hypothetical protein n=1 Tax=Microbacterium sp. BG28 TaxID=3097356 RepID=UPI002A5AE652|nr:hypothetical protein [Microbacterium sp. BG28]MDY0830654.1 hypothetical protein [Microbacterium sp. BG28]
MTESALHPLVHLGVTISSLCSRDKYSTDPAVHTAAVDEIRRTAGVHTDIRDHEVGVWVGYYGDDYTKTRAAALVDAFPGCVHHIALGVQRRGAGGHGTFETSMPAGVG